MNPTIEAWQYALMVRDSVFGQVFILTALFYLVYRFYIAKRLWRVVTITGGILLFLALLVGSVINIVLWQPY